MSEHDHGAAYRACPACDEVAAELAATRADADALRERVGALETAAGEYLDAERVNSARLVMSPSEEWQAAQRVDAGRARLGQLLAQARAAQQPGVCPACAYLATAPSHAADCTANPRLLVFSHHNMGARPPLVFEGDDEPPAFSGADRGRPMTHEQLAEGFNRIQIQAAAEPDRD